MKHKIVTSRTDSNQLDITIVSSDAELKTQLHELQANKDKRLWWFSSDESKEQKKEQRS